MQMQVNELITYIAFVLGFALTPGPNMMLYLTYTFEYGRKAGWETASGVVCSFVVHITAIILGLSAILVSSPYALDVLRYCGIVYLIYLAVINLKVVKWKTDNVVIENTGSGYFFIKGLIGNLLNPGSFFLYFSILPQFIHPERGYIWLQNVKLGSLQMLFSFLTNCTIIYFAGFVTDSFFKNERYQRLVRITMSLFILAFAMKMIFFKVQ
jgi:threonine/homoserine/homoserine lactone efflux protein